MSEQKLKNKVVVVTGGNSGIGLAAAKEFKAQGAHVVIAGRDENTPIQAAREIGDVPLPDVIEWLTRRRDHVAAGRSSIRVGHVDLFATPTGNR